LRWFQIYEASLNGGQRREITTTGLLQPVALAVDWLSRNLYIVDQLGRRIDLVSVTRRYQHNILSYTVSPSDIAVDPGQG